MDAKKLDGTREPAEVQNDSVQSMHKPPQAGSTCAQLRERLDKVTACVPITEFKYRRTRIALPSSRMDRVE
jgi:hypothetical protein